MGLWALDLSFRVRGISACIPPTNSSDLDFGCLSLLEYGESIAEACWGGSCRGTTGAVATMGSPPARSDLLPLPCIAGDVAASSSILSAGRSAPNPLPSRSSDGDSSPSSSSSMNLLGRFTLLDGRASEFELMVGHTLFSFSFHKSEIFAHFHEFFFQPKDRFMSLSCTFSFQD